MKSLMNRIPLMAGLVGIAACCAPAQVVLHDNGRGVPDAGLNTGSVSPGGVSAPAGAAWSLTSFDLSTGIRSEIRGLNVNNVQGVAADDFIVPSGETWSVTRFEIYVYQDSSSINPMTAMDIGVTDAPPNGPHNIIFDGSNNDLTSSTFANLYRASSDHPSLCTRPLDGGRPIFLNRCEIPPLILGPGTYWLVWGAQPSSGTAFTPIVAVMPLGSGAFVPGGNMLHTTGLTGWNANSDDGFTGPPGGPCAVASLAMGVEGPFRVLGTRVGQCPPDLTTTAIPGQPGYGVPNSILNNDDFFYFLAQFAAGNLAVADLTTTAVPGSPGFGVPNGVINNDDFFYYLTLFAAGC